MVAAKTKRRNFRLAAILLPSIALVALVACGSAGPEVTPTSDSRGEQSTPGIYKPVQIDRIKQFADIPPPLGRNAARPDLTHEEALERIGLHVPSFTSFFRPADDGGNLVVVLKDESELDRAIAAIAGYFGSDMITDTVLVQSAEYTISELTAWYQTARDVVGSMDGVYMSYLDERDASIRFGVVSQKTAEQVRAVLRNSRIPDNAIVLDVKGQLSLDDHVVELTSPQGIEISLEAPSQVRTGDTVDMAIVLTNRGDETVEFLYDADSPDDIVVYRDGVEVWSKNGRVGARTLAGRTAELDPGETLRFDTEWDLTDRDFEPLPSGDHVIAAKLSISERVPIRARNIELATEPVALRIVPGYLKP